MIQHFKYNRYTILIITLLLILINSAVINDLNLKSYQNRIFLVINAIGAIYLVWDRDSFRAKVTRYIGYGAVIVLISTFFTDFTAKLVYPYLVIYFISISGQVYYDILHAKKIDTTALTAVFCGFILLGYIATFSAYSLMDWNPNSFSGLSPTSSLFDDLTYLSFITILTIGYGDVTPSSDLAKVWAILFGLASNFYTVIVTGIVIGKYLNR